MKKLFVLMVIFEILMMVSLPVLIWTVHYHMTVATVIVVIVFFASNIGSVICLEKTGPWPAI